MGGSRRAAGAVMLAAASVLACGTPPSGADLEQRLRRQAEAVPDLPQPVRVMAFHADSEMAAWTEVARATSDGPSEQARALAVLFGRGGRERLSFVVGGPYPALNRRLLLDAFALVRPPRVPGLTVLLVSPEEPDPDVVAEAEKIQATLLYRVLPE